LALFREQLAEAGEVTVRDIVPISAASRQGIQSLLYKAADLLDEAIKSLPVEEAPALEERKIFRLEPRDDERDYTIRRDNDTFVIDSPSIERLIKRTNFGSHDGIQRFARILRAKGVDAALRKLGAEEGQTIRIGDFEFEFVERV